MGNEIKKVAVVTGGATGIGRAVAELSASSGYRVAVLYLNSGAEAESLAARLNAGGGLNAIAVRADVSDSASVKNAFRQVVNVFGRIDLLVNNAGIAENKLLIDMADDEIERIIAVDYKGVVYCAREAVKYMLASGGGVIVNIASVWGVVGAAMETVYSGAKAAVIGFTQALAKELGYSGIRVNAVSPGVIDTRMIAAYSESEGRAIIEGIPVGRMGKAEEVAECVKFLAESEYITGANIEINGGFKG